MWWLGREPSLIQFLEMAKVSYAGLTPFCATPTDVNPSDINSIFYNIGMNKSQICYFYWKVKYVIVSASYNYLNDGVINYYSFNGVLTPYPVEGYNLFVPNSETDLICGVGHNQIINYGGGTFGVNLVQYRAFQPNLVQCYLYNGLYYPCFAIASTDSAFRTFPNVGVVTGTLFGQQIPFYLPIANAQDVKISITAVEWPYNA